MRVYLLAGPGLDEFRRDVLQPFIENGRHSLCGCAIDVRPGKPLRRRVRENLRRGRGGYILVMALRLFARGRQLAYPTRAFCEGHGIPAIETDAPYSAATLAAMRAARPDAIALLGGFGIVKEPLLELAPRGVLGYHHGDPRRYRGQPPGLWELYHGERQMGVMVQRLGAVLDAGQPIVERSVSILPGDTPASLEARALAQSTGMLHQALDRLDDPTFEPLKIEQFGPVYTLPNLRQWLVLTARIARRKLRSRLGAAR